MTLHIVGAGLSGLSCALAAADAGLPVVLYEAAGHAGGRCRSWLEPKLDRLIDNGTHMVVGGNKTVFAFLRRIGSTDRLAPCPATFPMLDLKNGRRWSATPLRLLPSLLSASWRLRQHEGKTVGECLSGVGHYADFWDPLTLAIMNTPTQQTSATVFRRVLARTLWRGQAASRPFLARHGLSNTFVEPALKASSEAGISVHLHHSLRHLQWDGQKISGLVFDGLQVPVGKTDSVVLALPWAVARSHLPDLPIFPDSPIVNAHFRLSVPPSQRAPESFLGLLNATGQWLFLRDDVVSVTVSAAAHLVERSVDELAAVLWSDVSKAMGLKDFPAASRIIKEKRATIFHSPAMEDLRPRPQIAANLFLAGDWTATGLPCTIEGALWSGQEAARQVVSRQ
ncbi:MAG TPA: NAD(P)-binding protein [Rhodospirillaceae bacterium]|nr:NAD(P)-binding protein [Rhodospirillaceae bacterium]